MQKNINKNERINMFQIMETRDVSCNDAGNKVIADIWHLADKLNFKPVKIIWNNSAKKYFDRFKRKLRYYQDWKNCYNKINDNSIVLLQHPLHVANFNILRKLKYTKKVKFIDVIIDIEKIRFHYYKDNYIYYEKEFKTMLELTDILIVHNAVMAQYFIENGISKEKLINIESFDYLQNNNNIVEFEKSINFAGNLDAKKCGFIEHLNKLKNIKINLYGSNFNDKLLNSKNINYHGSFPPDEIPKKLNKGFGLVWDGDSIDTCSGVFGKYLKYNNPHKLSLYLSCGIPVVIWKQAAQAEFVKKYNVGICVESLKEAEQIINNITKNDFEALQLSVNKIKSFLCSGHFATKAINQALSLLQKV